jgi:signal transduction histidine kinase/ActR/RegA family two-component response regulator
VVINRDQKHVPGDPHDNDAAADTENPGLTDMDSPHKEIPPAAPEKDITLRESAVINDEAAVLSRENLASAREDAAHLRENANHLREEKASSRERVILAAETKQSASDDHMLMLQQVNARLIIATIEAQKLAEQLQATQTELENANIVAEAARAVAEKANLAKSNFLSSMSHELRTPLNAILGFAQLLEVGTPPPTDSQQIKLQQIVKSGWYLLELINEILDLAAIESGKVALSPETVSLTDVMSECQAMIETQAQQHNIRINYHPFDHSWHARADRTRLKQVLVNLLSNAVKYNREHGTVEVTCSASTPQRIRISIKDSGAGLPAEKLAQLFQPFNRLGQEAGSEQGTGIGLVVSKKLVELMGGAIGVESTVGAGSEFWIELERDAPPQLAAAHSVPAEPAPQAYENTALRTLLYIEDNPANLMLVEQVIEDHSHIRMLSARDGNQGIALARAQLPDVILLDINLPGLSGFDVLKLLRADPATSHIPVIAISANAMLRDIEMGLAAGFLRYLTKPIKINELMDALGEALTVTEAVLLNTNESE